MILVNGVQTDVIKVQDRGLQFGDGLFETMSLKDGKIRFLHDHLNRLEHGCLRLKLNMPTSDLIRSDIQRICDENKNGVIKIIITRGYSQRGYRFEKDITANRMVSYSALPSFPAENSTNGISVRLCQTRLGLNPALAGIKHLNRLESVMARAEWDDDTIAEGLLCDVEGNIVEGTMSNLFLVKDGELHTPLLEQCGVNGIVRTKIIQLAKELNINCIERKIAVEDLTGYKSAFICNSVIGIWPIREIIETGRYETQQTITNAIQDRFFRLEA